MRSQRLLYEQTQLQPRPLWPAVPSSRHHIHRTVPVDKRGGEKWRRNHGTIHGLWTFNMWKSLTTMSSSVTLGWRLFTVIFVPSKGLKVGCKKKKNTANMSCIEGAFRHMQNSYSYFLTDKLYSLYMVLYRLKNHFLTDCIRMTDQWQINLAFVWKAKNITAVYLLTKVFIFIWRYFHIWMVTMIKSWQKYHYNNLNAALTERTVGVRLPQKEGVEFLKNRSKYKVNTWGGVGTAVLASAVFCWSLLVTGCKAAVEDRAGAVLLLGRVGATRTGGRGAV